MSRQVMDIEAIMQQLIVEHRKLQRFVEAHQKAMKSLDLPAMEKSQREQEESRLRISGMENRRRALAIGVMITCLGWRTIGPQVQLFFFDGTLILALAGVCCVLMIGGGFLIRFVRFLRE